MQQTNGCEPQPPTSVCDMPTTSNEPHNSAIAHQRERHSNNKLSRRLVGTQVDATLTASIELSHRTSKNFATQKKKTTTTTTTKTKTKHTAQGP